MSSQLRPSNHWVTIKPETVLAAGDTDKLTVLAELSQVASEGPPGPARLQCLPRHPRLLAPPCVSTRCSSTCPRVSPSLTGALGEQDCRPQRPGCWVPSSACLPPMWPRPESEGWAVASWPLFLTLLGTAGAAKPEQPPTATQDQPLKPAQANSGSGMWPGLTRSREATGSGRKGLVRGPSLRTWGSQESPEPDGTPGNSTQPDSPALFTVAQPGTKGSSAPHSSPQRTPGLLGSHPFSMTREKLAPVPLWVPEVPVTASRQAGSRGPGL